MLQALNTDTYRVVKFIVKVQLVEKRMKSHFGKLKEIKNNILGITLRIALSMRLNEPSQVVEVLTTATVAVIELVSTVVSEETADFVIEDIDKSGISEAIVSKILSLTAT